MVQKHHRLDVRKLALTCVASGLLMVFSSAFIYAGTAYANSTSLSLINQAATDSPTTVLTPTPIPKPSLIPAPVLSNQSTSQPNASDYLLQLASGLVGAILGAVIGVLGTIYATRSQIQAIYSQEKENREYAEKRQKEAIRNSLRVETQENLNLVNDTSRKVLLSTEAWSTYKGNISAFSASLQEELIKLYSKVRLYNSIIEQVYAMYLNKMDNEPLFHLQKDIEKELISICGSMLKKLSEE